MFIDLTLADEKNTKITVVSPQVFGVFIDPQRSKTALAAQQGGVTPVQEALDEVLKLLPASVRLEHANLKTSVYFIPSAVAAVYRSEVAQATHVVSIGGGVVPVSESVNEVRARLKKATEGEKENE